MGRTLKGLEMNVIFFYHFAIATFQMGGSVAVSTYVLSACPLITIYRGLYSCNQLWPFSLITERKYIQPVHEQLRQYLPRSDLLVLKSKLPRLLVEVNSEPMKDWPEDLIRMLLMGGTVVRFANSYLDRFREEENFVLFAMYIWETGEVSHYSLFQASDSQGVCWTLYISKPAY